MISSFGEIKRLRELTGVGMTDAKKALEDSSGDFDAALSAMRKKGLTKAEKRMEREARAGVIGTYNHNNRIGVLVEVNCETDFVARNEIFTNLVKDLTLHIAASNPEYLTVDDIPLAVKKQVTDDFSDKLKADNKPAEMITKIAGEQVKKYFDERCLLTQPFVKDPDQTVGDYIKQNNAKLGENIVVRRFARMALGEV
ncbi:MAG TPA: elongation factor Ts [Patescibacteria group bacterium]|jgi:elongation factor Ts|nr:elongation factor Ts [Patescibacteria group bacterium]